MGKRCQCHLSLVNPFWKRFMDKSQSCLQTYLLRYIVLFRAEMSAATGGVVCHCPEIDSRYQIPELGMRARSESPKANTGRPGSLKKSTASKSSAVMIRTAGATKKPSSQLCSSWCVWLNCAPLARCRRTFLLSTTCARQVTSYAP